MPALAQLRCRAQVFRETMTARRYRIFPQAEADLDTHARTTALDHLDVGLRLYDRAEETYARLAEMPHTGALHQSEKIGLSGIRYLPIKESSRYLVLYRPTDDGVEIIRILHARMDKDTWL